MAAEPGNKIGRIPLNVPFTTRTGVFDFTHPTAQKDSFLFNAFVDRRATSKMFTRRRPGTVRGSGFVRAAGLVAVIPMGDTGVGTAVVTADASNFYVTGVGGLTHPNWTVPAPGPIAGSLFTYGIGGARYDGATIVLAYQAQVSSVLHFYVTQINVYTGAYTTSAAIPLSPTANAASCYVVNVAVLDTYVFVGIYDNPVLSAAASGEYTLYASDVGAPTTFTSGNYTAVPNGAPGTFLQAQGSYLVAGTSEGIYFYYDTANATGFPLSLYKDATLPIGCTNVSSSTEKGLLFIGYVNQVMGIYLLPNNTQQLQKLSDDATDYLLNGTANLSGNLYTTTACIDFAVVYGSLKAMVVFSPVVAAGYFPYIAVDAESKVTTLGSLQINGFTAAGGYTISALIGLTSARQQGGGGFTFFYNASPSGYEYAYLKADDNENTIWTDDCPAGVANIIIPVVMQTPLNDLDVKNYKFFYRIELIGNQATSTQIVETAYTGNDYQSFSTQFGIDISRVRPLRYRCGSDRRRAFQIVDNNNADLQLEALEIEYDIGTS